MFEKLEFIISSPKKVISTVFALILVLSLPLTILLVSRQQDIRQRAAESNPIGVINGVIWKDMNGNGIKDAQDVGFAPPNTKVKLSRIDNKTDRFTVPGDHGRYTFNIFNQVLFTLSLEGLPPGYKVVKSPNNKVAFLYPPLSGTSTVTNFDFFVQPLPPELAYSPTPVIKLLSPTPTPRELAYSPTPVIKLLSPTPTPRELAYSPTPVIKLLSPTPTKVPTTTPTKTPNPTPTTHPLPTPTSPPSPTVTPIPQAGDVMLSFAYILPGISNEKGGNLNPKRPNRLTTITINKDQTNITKTESATFSNGVYKGSVNLGPNYTGPVAIKIKTDGGLTKSIPGIVYLKEGNNNLPTSNIVMGDLDNNNIININDWNAFISCYQLANGLISGNIPATCINADLNDDGEIDGLTDLNILYRAFSVREGD